jgi:hypothetical protein
MFKALLAVAFVACSSSAPSSQAPAPAPQPAPPAAEPTPAAARPATAPGIGEKCGAADACAPPATCVVYYGIAGKRGPEFKTCEVKCGPTTTCPDGKTCRTIADGPGSVCR